MDRNVQYIYQEALKKHYALDNVDEPLYLLTSQLELNQNTSDLDQPTQIDQEIAYLKDKVSKLEKIIASHLSSKIGNQVVADKMDLLKDSERKALYSFGYSRSMKTSLALDPKLTKFGHINSVSQIQELIAVHESRLSQLNQRRYDLRGLIEREKRLVSELTNLNDELRKQNESYQSKEQETGQEFILRIADALSQRNNELLDLKSSLKYVIDKVCSIKFKDDQQSVDFNNVIQMLLQDLLKGSSEFRQLTESQRPIAEMLLTSELIVLHNDNILRVRLRDFGEP